MQLIRRRLLQIIKIRIYNFFKNIIIEIRYKLNLTCNHCIFADPDIPVCYGSFNNPEVCVEITEKSFCKNFKKIKYKGV